MKALVLGGSGFIGSHVVDALLRAGCAVTVFDRGPEIFRSPLPGVTYTFSDFADQGAMSKALMGQDVVFHLISTTFPASANLNPKADVTGNLLGTLNLIELMNSIGISRLIYLSSGGTVYGRPEMEPISEDHPMRPIGSYGIVKAAVEQYLEMYRLTSGLRPLAIRAANPFGPRQGHTGVQGVISTFMRRVIAGEPVEIWGDGSVVRDYLYVADLAELCVMAAKSDLVGAVNAGSGKGHSLNDIIESIAGLAGYRPEIRFLPGRLVDVPSSILDISRANKFLDWSPSTSFEDAMSHTWRWLVR